MFKTVANINFYKNKNSTMKKFFIILLSIISLILLLLVVTPFLFKNKILETVKTEINKNVNAKVDFDDLSLSLLRDFPQLRISLEHLSVVGIEPFQGDTLVEFQSFSAGVDVLSFLLDDKISVKKVVLTQPNIYARVLKDGKANWDIAKESGEKKEEPTTQTAEKNISVGLEKFIIEKATIYYQDETLDLLAGVKNLNYELSGDFSSEFTSLTNKLEIEMLSVLMEGIKYLNKSKLKFDAAIDADLKNMAFKFKENLLKINNLQLNFEGDIKMPSDDIDINITYNAPKTNFKDVISLIPAIFMKDFKGLKTGGTFDLKGAIKGIYNQNTLPGFNLFFSVTNGMFKYPDLPKSVDDINVSLKIINPGGSGDINDIDISKFHMSIAENPLDAKMHIKTTSKDVNIKGKLKSKLDLANIKDVLPLEDTELAGIIHSDVSISGNLSSIEKEKYEEFDAKGKISMEKLQYKSADFPQGIEIKSSLMKFSPQKIELEDFSAISGKSDFSVSGKLTNYMAFALKDEKLVGNLSLNSSFLDLNPFMTSETSQETSAGNDSVPMEAVKIPENIDFVFQSKLKKVNFDNIEIDDMNGQIIVRDGKLHLPNLGMGVFGGLMQMSGYYDSKNIEEPKVNFKFDLLSIAVKNIVSKVDMLKEFSPILEACAGKMSLGFEFSSSLDKYLNPVFSTTNGNGKLNAKEMKINKTKTFSELGEKLKTKIFDSFALKDIDVGFEIKNGNLYVQPFTTNIGKNKIRIEGRQSLDKSLDFSILVDMPKEQLGKKANEVLSGLSNSSGLKIDKMQNLKFDVRLGGTADNPKIAGIKLKTQDNESLKDEAEKQVKEKIDVEKEKVKEKVDLEKEKAKDEAKKQIDTLKQKTKDEAEKLKKDLEKKKKETEKKTKEKLKKNFNKLF